MGASVLHRCTLAQAGTQGYNHYVFIKDAYR
jgi:hypothetical protein